jgi:hypothetical protein
VEALLKKSSTFEFLVRTKASLKFWFKYQIYKIFKIVKKWFKK